MNAVSNSVINLLSLFPDKVPEEILAVQPEQPPAEEIPKAVTKAEIRKQNRVIISVSRINL